VRDGKCDAADTDYASGAPAGFDAAGIAAARRRAFGVFGFG
jgi:hypothetical protein